MHNAERWNLAFSSKLLGLDQSESFQMLLECCDVSGQLMFFEREQEPWKIDFQMEGEEMPVSRSIYDRFCSGKNYCISQDV